MATSRYLMPRPDWRPHAIGNRADVLTNEPQDTFKTAARIGGEIFITQSEGLRPTDASTKNLGREIHDYPSDRRPKRGFGLEVPLDAAFDVAADGLHH